ncbi:hypothetical protein LCGC14_1622150 [marine sediment metagenome]|uniref:Uncharacterized protein n=1 Tax=marine sediment metagenome TaxID=412755 RepID=A0A0F9L558_9ZZZZ
MPNGDASNRAAPRKRPRTGFGERGPNPFGDRTMGLVSDFMGRGRPQGRRVGPGPGPGRRVGPPGQGGLVTPGAGGADPIRKALLRSIIQRFSGRGARS